jgi:hypothetical protein
MGVARYDDGQGKELVEQAPPYGWHDRLGEWEWQNRQANNPGATRAL